MMIKIIKKKLNEQLLTVSKVALCLLWLVDMTTASAEDPSTAVWRLSEFGPVRTVAEASVTADKAAAEVAERGGGLIILDGNTAADFLPTSPHQQGINQPGVGFLDLRQGKIRLTPPALGYRIPTDPQGYASLFLDREVNQEAINLNGKDYIARLSSSQVRGTASYFQDVRGQENLADSDLIRVYPATTQGLYPGMVVFAFSGQAQTSRGAEFTATVRSTMRVNKLGWNSEAKLPYADLELVSGERPSNIIRLINKSGTGTLYLADNRNVDSEGFTMSIRKNQFGVGDNFGIDMNFSYMSNIMSTMGDEGGNAYTVDIWQLLDSFLGTVESWDPHSQSLVYGVESLQANTLGTSRPLINLNPDKWITQGKVVIETNHDILSAMQGKGAVIGQDTGWSEEIVGRYFALDDPSEYAGYAREGQRTFWRHALGDRPVRRWWRITHYEKGPEGKDRLWIERIRWLAYDRAIPSLLDRANTGRPLAYVIAPGASVVDVSEALPPVRRHQVKEAPEKASELQLRRIVLAPTSTTGTTLDFEAGDPIEQAVGPDPSHPNGFRVRHRQAMPGIRGEASFLSINNGNYPVDAGLAIKGQHDQMHVPGQSKFHYGVDISASTDVGVRIGGRTARAALSLESESVSDIQAIGWRQGNRSARLYYDFQRDALVQTAETIDLSKAALTQLAGLSGTTRRSENLRGINVVVPSGQTQVKIDFPQAEADGNYSLTVQPSWLTRTAVVDKAGNGFQVLFDTPAPVDARLDWQLIR